MTKLRKGSIGWALTHDDWSDLTVDQIAEVLDAAPASIHKAIAHLRKEGIHVVYTKKSAGRPMDI